MIGNDEDELGTFFAPSFVPDEATYAAELSAIFGAALGAQVLAQYPAAAYPNPYRAFIAATSDHLFICPARRIARAYAAAFPDHDDGARVYRYLFTHALENPNPFVGRGAVHTTDLPFIFHTLGMGGLAYTPTAAEQVLSTAMATTWISFAREANPNNALIPSWRRYDSGADSYLQFNDAMTAEAGVHTAQCDFWDGIDNLIEGAGYVLKASTESLGSVPDRWSSVDIDPGLFRPPDDVTFELAKPTPARQADHHAPWVRMGPEIELLWF